MELGSTIEAWQNRPCCKIFSNAVIVKTHIYGPPLWRLVSLDYSSKLRHSEGFGLNSDEFEPPLMKNLYSDIC